jgi:hypothetical protein
MTPPSPPLSGRDEARPAVMRAFEAQLAVFAGAAPSGGQTA